MGHNHEHSGGHHHHAVSPAQAASSAYVIGIVLNLAYVVAEAVAGFWVHSLALITDAGHNLSDVASLGLSLLAFRLAKIKPTREYTYGYKKSTVLSALVNATFLLISIGILGYEAVRRINHPVPVEGGMVTIVSGIGIVINGLSAFLFFKHKDGELNARGAYLHLLADMLVSIGVVVAGIIIVYTHWYWLDPVVSLIVLVVILFSTWSLLTDGLKMSLDAVPSGIKTEDIINTINTVAGVRETHHVHIWALSTTENALTAHVILDRSLTFEQKSKTIRNIKHELEHANIHHATLEMEVPGDPCPDDEC